MKIHLLKWRRHAHATGAKHTWYLHIHAGLAVCGRNGRYVGVVRSRVVETVEPLLTALHAGHEILGNCRGHVLVELLATPAYG